MNGMKMVIIPHNKTSIRFFLRELTPLGLKYCKN
jgi:hypothetical protein